MMPKMTGLEAASTMRRAYPHDTLPILLVTAKNRPEDVVAGLRAGADDYLAKPVHGAELLARVTAHVAGVRAMRVADRLVAPELVNLVERGHVSELARGAFASRSLGLLHVAIEGLGGLAARLDEATLYARLDEAFAAIAQPLVDHGAVLELVGVDSVRFVLPRFDEAFVGAIERVLARVAAGLPTGLGLGASLHAGHVSIGAFGDASWLAVRAVGEPVLLSGELARWGARRGFRLLVTDAALAKLDVRPLSRRVGTVRLGEAGHASTAFELVDRDHERTSLDACVDALEAGRIDELQATLAELGRGDPLVALLSEQVRRGQREVVLGGP
jgi:CheY-like chemotaxis protein